MKILYVVTLGGTMWFFKGLVKNLIDNGNVVDIACNEEISPIADCYREWGCNVYNMPCQRSPIARGNISAVKILKKIIKDNKYDIVHCHTPIASVCTRLASIKYRKRGLNVFYTAHGFHFYSGSSKKNWALFFPIEFLCSFVTDVLITINKEDYRRANKLLHAKKTVYVPGVGIDVNKFSSTSINIENKRKELEIPKDDVVLISVGELNQNKNQEAVIRALAEIDNRGITYLVAGEGQRKQYLLDLAKELGVENKIRFLGFRKDVNELYKCSDLFVHCSFREGLPVAVMEALAAGIPVIASDIRGCSDLVNQALRFAPTDYSKIAFLIEEILLKNNTELASKSEEDRTKILNYDVSNVNEMMKELYYSATDVQSD